MANLEELRKKLSVNTAPTPLPPAPQPPPIPPLPLLPSLPAITTVSQPVAVPSISGGGGNGGGDRGAVGHGFGIATGIGGLYHPLPIITHTTLTVTSSLPTTIMTTPNITPPTTTNTNITNVTSGRTNPFLLTSGNIGSNILIGRNNNNNNSNNGGGGGAAGIGGNGHARSISHGGGSLSTSVGGYNPMMMGGISTISGQPSNIGSGIVQPIVGGRPLRSALKGHQRAFSHGQIPESQQIQPRSGHNRVGSKTDFILPPGHKDPIDNDRGLLGNESGGVGGGHHMIGTGPIGTGGINSAGTISVTSSGTTGTTGSGSGGGGGGGGPGSAGYGHSRQASRSESIYTLRRAEIPPLWKRLFIFKNNKFDENTYRIVVPNHTVPPKTPKREHPNGRRIGNKIRTTKYTILSFIPKNLLEQFHRVANLYFIFIVLLNWFIDAFGKEVAMIPVLFVLGVTAIKDLFEDRRRRASDKRINNSTCRVYSGESERYKKVIWQNLRVGDLIHLSNNETVPADILLLRSSNAHGVCYIDTCDLDGETNLKSRQVVRGFAEKQHNFQPNKFVSRIEVDAPTTKIYRFHGAMIHSTGERVPISTENLLLRESRLKNTDYVEGLVIYAGHETKAMLNNSGPRYKRSQLEQQMNVDVIWCVIILIILCVIGAVGCKLWLSSFQNVPIPFLPFEVNPALESLWTFWTYVIILQVMIPLSLYVTIELCKILQVYHIHNNIDLFDMQTNKRTECRAMNITEELGQIQHIFSDKTGTLTENKMLFRRCTINGIDYNHPKSDLEEEFSKPGSLAPPIIVNGKLSEDMCQSVNGQMFTVQSQRIQEFLLVLAICNTVVVSATPHRDTMNASGVIELQDEPTIGVKIVRPNDIHVVNVNHVTSSGSTGGGGGGSSSSIAIGIGAGGSTNDLMGGDKYTRLTESRSVTPSPPPIGPSSLSLKQHIPSLSPISSSNESSPTSESPPTKIRSNNINNNLSPTHRAKTLLTSKLTTITSMLNNKSHNKKIISKLKRSSPRIELSSPDGRPIYEAESPDELALVNAAFSYDCCLINRSPNHILVSSLNNALNEYEILKVLPFDSHRKCMSIVVRRTGGSQDILVYTKGADTTIMSALTPCSPDSDEGILREKTQQQLDVYARQGLRVLVMAKRVMNALEFVDWWNKHQEIEMCMENREKRIRESYMWLENHLTLLGATGIEDRLQDGVPETITALRAAGIAIWVLTGDKPETAINVAYSAKLFQPQMEILRLAARSRDAAESSIAFYLSEIEKQNSTNGLLHRRTPIKAKALVVDGKTLTFILDLRSNLTKPFLSLTKLCVCVLCCRSTPLQKAFLVKVVKEDLQLRTLAIGDGANDVSMIQMADVGVGISGQEGMQAVMASDFTLSRFKFLENLLITHGFWSYDRLSRMILYFFYKNATFVFLIFWYQLYCGFSGSVMIDQMYLMLYNLFFTSLPPLAIGVYDKTVPEDLLMARPYLYRYGRLGLAYKPHSFWITMLDAIYQSLIIYFIALLAYWDTDVGIWEFGTTITTSCLITMLIHGAIEIKSWTILHVMSIVCSLGAYYLFAIVYNTWCVKCFGLPSTYWVMHMCLASPVHWFIIILTAIVCVLPRLVFRVIQTSFYPDDATLALLQQKRAQQRGEDLLVAWSRSTSASSIYRTTDFGIKNQYVATIS